MTTTTKKKKETGITRPRPDGGVKRSIARPRPDGGVKSPRGIRPRRCSPSPRGVKHIKVTQDTIPSRCSERHGEYLCGRAKTGSLGQVTKKKKENKKRPRGIGLRRFSPPPRGQNMLRSLNIRAQGV